MTNTYFHRVHAQTPTRLWINNPTDEEAALAIRHGALHCTTNPTYTAKMLKSPAMRPLALDWLRNALAQADGDADTAAVLAQRHAVAHLMGQFLPLYECAPGSMGYVSLQGSPLREDDPDCIVQEALDGRALGPNYIAKIPVTASGLSAIDALVRQNVPIIATEIMSVSQMLRACEAYSRASVQSGHRPDFFVTSIAGIFDDSLKKTYGGQLEQAVLAKAGAALTRRQYRLMRELDLPGVLLGGGARSLEHFTEFVGGDMHITLNWAGSAQTLIELDAPVECRMEAPIAPEILEALRTLPDFARAYERDGLDVAEYEHFAPVELFRSMFIAGWEELVGEIQEIQEEILS